MKKYLLILLAIATMISACSPAESTPSLTGTTWKLVSYGKVDSLRPVVAEEGTLTLGTDGKLTGVGACNEFSGTYEVNGQQIIFSDFDWGSKFCPEPQMTQESTVYDTLNKRTVDFKVEGKTLTLTRPLTETDALVLVFEAVSGPASASTSDSVKVLENYYDALTASDLEKAMSFVADDAVFIDPMGKYVGKENIRDVYAAQMNIGGRWEVSEIKDVNGKGRLVYQFKGYINDRPVYSGPGLTVIKDGKIIFDGSEGNWKGECDREPSQSFCSD